MNEREQLTRSWVSNADAWRDAVREQRIESRRRVTDAAVLAAVNEQSPHRVLDLGCGEGWLTRALAAPERSVIGVDASEPLVLAARELGGQFVCATYDELIETPAIAGAEFDVVVANFSLLDDRVEELLRAMRLVLRPDGKLIVQTAHPAFARGEHAYADGWRVETFATFEGEWREPMPWYFRTVGSWTRTFIAAGYELLELREPLHPDTGIPLSAIFIASVA